MSKRICILEYCDKCPYFDNGYYGYHELCVKLDRVIKCFDGHYEIPEDCPLVELKEGE